MVEPRTVTVPLRRDTSGTLRVGGTRVVLDLVVHAFEEGATPEEIVQRYSTLKLADVYAVISYYLQNREEVDAYLRQRAEEAAELQERIERETDARGLRERLLARRIVVG